MTPLHPDRAAVAGRNAGLISVDTASFLAFNAVCPPDCDPRRATEMHQAARTAQNDRTDRRHFEHVLTRMGRAVRNDPRIFFVNLLAYCARCVVNTTNAERGRAVRRALLAVARLSLEQRVLFPKYCTLASAMGCDGSNIARHLAMLQSVGDVSFVSAGRRLYVVAVRS